MHFYPNQDKTGVIRVEELENERTTAEQIANERIKKGLKHKVPSILKLNSGELIDEEIEFFYRIFLQDFAELELCTFFILF